jgi:hypothetical protein
VSRRIRQTASRMSNVLFGSFDLGPPRKTGDDWYYAPRPSESRNAASVRIVTGPAGEHEREKRHDDEL